MADVAAQAGVSRALVSLVFRNAPGASEQTRQRVFQVASKIGYRPDSAARMLASTRTRVLGVMITLRHPFHAELVEQIYPAAEASGYEILLSSVAPTHPEHRAIEALLSHRCEGVILLGPEVERDYLSAVGDKVPTVAVSTRATGINVDLVRSAEAKGVRQALEHLVTLGHRNIVHIDGGDGPGSAERRRAYRATMRKHGLREYSRVIPGDHTEAAGVHGAEVLLGEGKLPTAVLASNDRCALGLLDALRKAGVRVPDDISVVGYDDSHVATLSYIDLTTVHQDVDGIAKRAVEAVVERIEDRDLEPREIVLDPGLVVRGTTGPPRQD
ncbi:LacI family DNA-binding transcriptional regulator [Haloechinothrix sp. LS1_15]|uniref:LacI family DNA-binding transcriptional regulator n=1 Tax=Haloechinothrix sp. LS1_15 TaxID=2652248 RepID=UPI0029469150|nr:LacI family DNA-binding transcriptional regulator [Haloechinothrix sp. LS1_15]MDV6012594.1 LacI family transcriptional regulator [Haloechinothrix sp. LS1_15]